MSHSTVVVFFIVLVGIYITHGGQPCAEDTGTCIPIAELSEPTLPRCSPLIPNYIGCPPVNRKKPGQKQPCCVDCQQKFINDTCNFLVTGSVGQFYNNQTHCCPDMYQVAKPFPDSPCRCCQTCPPTRRCVFRKGYCVTEDDPTRSVASCIEKGWRINEKWCKGDGCFCCYRPKKK